jgi:hypothetical protein
VQSANVDGQQFVRLKHADFETTNGQAVWVRK